MKAHAHRLLLAFALVLAVAGTGYAAEATQEKADRLNAQIDAAWSTADFRVAQAKLLELLKKFENREIDGKRLIIRKVHAIRSNIDTDTPPKAVALEDGALGLRLPGEGTWTIELDVSADVNYKFLFFGYKDRVNATIRIKGLSLTVVPDLERLDRIDLETLFSSKLRIAEVREAKYEGKVLGEHPMIRDYHELIDEKLNAGIALLIDLLPGRGADDAKAALASKPAAAKPAGSPNFARKDARRPVKSKSAPAKRSKRPATSSVGGR